MNPAQNRTGLASAVSHDSQDVSPAGRAAIQLDSSTLLPAPADPATRVSRWPAPVVSWSCRADRVTSVLGSGGGRNFATANRTPGRFPAPTKAPSATARIMPDPKGRTAVRTPFHLATGAGFITRKV